MGGTGSAGSVVKKTYSLYDLDIGDGTPAANGKRNGVIEPAELEAFKNIYIEEFKKKLADAEKQANIGPNGVDRSRNNGVIDTLEEQQAIEPLVGIPLVKKDTAPFTVVRTRAMGEAPEPYESLERGEQMIPVEKDPRDRYTTDDDGNTVPKPPPEDPFGNIVEKEVAVTKRTNIAPWQNEVGWGSQLLNLISDVFRYSYDKIAEDAFNRRFGPLTGKSVSIADADWLNANTAVHVSPEEVRLWNQFKRYAKSGVLDKKGLAKLALEYRRVGDTSPRKTQLDKESQDALASATTLRFSSSKPYFDISKLANIKINWRDEPDRLVVDSDKQTWTFYELYGRHLLQSATAEK